MKHFFTRCAAAVLALTLLLAGCGEDTAVSAVQPGQRVSDDSPWIDSDLNGALLADTPVNPRDDFAAAVNRDWAAVTAPDEEWGSTDAFQDAEDILAQRLLEIATGVQDGGAGGENPSGIPQVQLAHDEALLSQFAALASDWDSRDGAGVEALRPYVDAITGVDSLEDMTRWLLNEEGQNLCARTLSPLWVAATLVDHTTNVVQVGYPTGDLLLTNASQYTNLDQNGRMIKQANETAIRALMARLGFDDAAAGDALKRAYRFELRLIDASENLSEASSMDMAAAIAGSDNRLSLEELEAMQGDYPLTEILRRYGYDGAGEVSVDTPQFIQTLARLYTAENLEELKAYFLVHTLLDAMPLLDREALECYDSWYEPVHGENAVTGNDGKDLLSLYLNRYLAEPLGQVYIARYCSAQQKQELTELIQDIIAYYRVMLQTEDWLSEKTRALAVEKLDNMAVRVLYPDTFRDYTALDLTGCASLPEAVARINIFSQTSAAARAGTPADRSAWDLAERPTTVANAYYMPLDNSINILAGYVANSFLYDPQAPMETKLARVGFVVGHEITHAFDTTGYNYDKDGSYVGWWTSEDVLNFETRAGAISLYYSALIPYPGATGYDGNKVQGEVIADLGGMKCMLALARDIPDFDYKLFFESYAQLWRRQSGLGYEKALVEQDEHPLSYLRINVMVQQLEEFYETFGISEGDGMYLAPEKRLAVW